MPTTEYYRYGKGQRRSHEGRLQWYSVTIALLLVTVLVLSAVLWMQTSSHRSKSHKLSALELVLDAQEQELSVLRTINPYQYKYEQILSSKEVTRDMLPGWITRVYPAPNSLAELGSMMDMGAFILDQSKFTLASHESYGVESPVNPLYRLNGVLPSASAGRYQIGMRFAFTGTQSHADTMLSKYASCFTQIVVNNERIVEQRIRLNAGAHNNELITADVVVSKGLHPISVVLYCDSDSFYSGDDVQISMSFREPGAPTFTDSAHSVFHLYQRSRS